MSIRKITDHADPSCRAAFRHTKAVDQTGTIVCMDAYVHVCCRFWYVGRCPKVIFVSRGVSFFGNFTLTGLHLLFFVCYQALLCELVREINTKKYVLAFRYYKALLEQFIDYILLVQKYGYIATADML